MALQRLELWKNRQTSSPTPVRKILKSIRNGYNKWTQVRMLQEP